MQRWRPPCGRPTRRRRLRASRRPSTPKPPPQNGPGISLYLTLFGIVLGFLSLFWSFGYVRLSRRLRAFLDAPTLDAAPKIRRSDVIAMLEKVRRQQGVAAE